MADCFPFPPESDDLHRRWLPREIFADIGIVDPDSAAEPTPEAAAAAAVEELAAQLAGILGGGGGANKVWPLAPPSPPPASPPVSPPAAATTAPCHAAKVCGLEGNVAVMSCGGPNGGGGAGAAVTWPFMPYPQFQWQVGGSSGLVNHGGVLDCYSVLPPALPCHVPPPPANLRTGGGTGVFLPRVEAYRYSPATTTPSPPATAKGGAWAPATKPWAAGTGGRPATAKKPPPQTEHATPTKQQHQKPPSQQQATTGAALALPQDWSYR